MKHLATIAGVQNLLRDARSGSQDLMVCVWEGYHHLALLLDDFCIADAVERQSRLWRVHWVVRDELAAAWGVCWSTEQGFVVLEGVHDILKLGMMLW